MAELVERILLLFYYSQLTECIGRSLILSHWGLPGNVLVTGAMPWLYIFPCLLRLIKFRRTWDNRNDLYKFTFSISATFLFLKHSLGAITLLQEHAIELLMCYMKSSTS